MAAETLNKVTRRKVLWPGSRIGRYQIVTELGRGGMGDVYLAVRRGPDLFEKLVVIKVLKHELASDPACVTMFLDEARLTAKFNHPNIAQTNEAGNESGHRYIAMEFLDGQPLSAFRRVSRTDDRAKRVELYVLVELLKALHYAHNFAGNDGENLNIVHRDATPHNVFITYDGAVKLVDFGIAKTRYQVSETALGVLKGKLHYIAPEQAIGAVIDRRVDLFTVGVVLWEILTGRRYWEGCTDPVLVERLFRGDLPEARDASISPALQAVCSQALAANRETRFQTAEAFRLALEAAIASEPGVATTQSDVAAFVNLHFDEERKDLQAEIKAALSNAKKRSKVPTSADAASESGVRDSAGYAAAENDEQEATETRVTAETMVQRSSLSQQRWPLVAAALAFSVMGAFVSSRLLAQGVTFTSLQFSPRIAVVALRTLRAQPSVQIQAPTEPVVEKALGVAKRVPLSSSSAIDLEFPKGPPREK
jgi:eukaryotic-like serine/threonine-protein kinase